MFYLVGREELPNYVKQLHLDSKALCIKLRRSVRPKGGKRYPISARGHLAALR
jgi:hypothetical protein